jgi:ketosteroid isomerase-like protein
MNVPSTPAAKSPLFPCSHRAAIALLTFAAILAPAFSPTATPAPQASTLVTLAKIREAWVQDLRTKQLEPILKFYAPDAVFLQPTGERITGSAALRALFQTIMATFNSDLTLHSQNFETSGDLAYDSGDFQETLTTIATGAKITSKGSYIIIFKRQPNSSWQIVQHVWTGTPPPGT